MNEFDPVPLVSELPGALVSAFPDYRELVDEAVAEHEQHCGFLDFDLISGVFRWHILEESMMSGDDARVKSCFDFMERLMGSPDDRILEATAIRVIPYLLQDQHWRRATLRHAGAFVVEALNRYTEDENWRST